MCPGNTRCVAGLTPSDPIQPRLNHNPPTPHPSPLLAPTPAPTLQRGLGGGIEGGVGVALGRLPCHLLHLVVQRGLGLAVVLQGGGVEGSTHGAGVGAWGACDLKTSRAPFEPAVQAEACPSLPALLGAGAGRAPTAALTILGKKSVRDIAGLHHKHIHTAALRGKRSSSQAMNPSFPSRRPG